MDSKEYLTNKSSVTNHLNARHLPEKMLNLVKTDIIAWLDKKPGYLLEDGLRNVLQYINNPIEKKMDLCLEEIAKMDRRRGIDSRKIFTEFYNSLERQ